MRIRILGLVLFQLCCYRFGYAQENIRVDLRDDLIIIMYDLKPSATAADFKVEIFGSHNNYEQPIVQVSGDVGSAVRPGLNKIISWASKAELKDFKGELIFEIAATPNVPLPVQSPVTMKQEPTTEPLTGTANYSRPDNYLSQLKQGKMISRIALATGVAATGMGFYFKSAANKYYKQYQSASSQANDLRDKVEQNDRLYPVALGIGGVSLLTALYFSLKVQKQKRNWGISAVPMRSGLQVAYHYNF